MAGARSDRLDLYQFRKTYKIPAASIRAICKKCKIDIIKEEDRHYIDIKGKRDGYTVWRILTHAVLEFRDTMDIKSTLAGIYDLYEEVPTPKRNNVDPLTPALQRLPNRNPKLEAPKIAPKSGAVGITAQSGPPATAPKQNKVKAPRSKPEHPPKAPEETSDADTSNDAPTNALLPQQQLWEAMERGYLITTPQLAQIIGLSPDTLKSRGSSYKKFGFMMDKVKEGAYTLWKISQY